MRRNGCELVLGRVIRQPGPQVASSSLSACPTWSTSEKLRKTNLAPEVRRMSSDISQKSGDLFTDEVLDFGSTLSVSVVEEHCYQGLDTVGW